MQDDDHGDAPDRQHRDDHAQDRQLDELTSELRTVIPGVTVLLAFLLTVPFTAGFPTLRGIDRAAYFVAFLSTALAVIFLLGESAYHRIRGKPYEWIYVLSGRLYLILGHRELDLEPGEVVEFDTRTPHLIANRGDHPTEMLALFGPQGQRMHVRSGT